MDTHTLTEQLLQLGIFICLIQSNGTLHGIYFYSIYTFICLYKFNIGSPIKVLNTYLLYIFAPAERIHGKKESCEAHFKDKNFKLKIKGQ